jgi:hypothetical protein
MPEEYAAGAEMAAAAMRSLNQGTDLVARSVTRSLNGHMPLTEAEIGVALPDGHEPVMVAVEAAAMLGEAKIMAAQTLMLGALVLTLHQFGPYIPTMGEFWPTGTAMAGDRR